MPISLSQRTHRLLAPAGLVHAAMPSLTGNARQQATWLWQSMQIHQMALWYDNWVQKNYGVDPLHPDHSINCKVVAVLHLPAHILPHNVQGNSNKGTPNHVKKSINSPKQIHMT